MTTTNDNTGAAPLPPEPPNGLLHSMAVRYDHGLAIPGHYDQPMYREVSNETHESRYLATIATMRQLYEEVSGHGFYDWPNTVNRVDKGA